MSDYVDVASSADVLEIFLCYIQTNHVVKISPPLVIDTFFDISRCFSLHLDASKVIIISPKSWQNINRLSNYRSKKNGYKILNVGDLIDYVFVRREKTMKLLKIISGKNCETIKLSSIYNIESNNFRISVINGNLKIIIIAGVKYLIFRFLTPYLNSNTNTFEPLFCVCVENRPNERQYWQCMNIFTTQEVIEHFQSVIGIYNKNSNNNSNNNNNTIRSQIIEQLFLPPANICISKVFHDLPFGDERLHELISRIKNCLKDKNNNKLNKHLLEELENILNENKGMSVDDLIQLIYGGIKKSVFMAIEYGIVATQKYIDKRGMIYFELILLLEIETQAGIYQFGLALIENKIYNGNNNGYQIYGYDVAAILTWKMTRDNVSQNNGILCYYYMKNKCPDGNIIDYWPLYMRPGPRKTSFFDKVKQQRQEQMLQQQQRQTQTLNSAKAQNAQNAQNAQINNNNNNNAIVVVPNTSRLQAIEASRRRYAELKENDNDNNDNNNNDLLVTKSGLNKPQNR